MPPPQNQKDIKQILGLIGYCCNFVPSYVDIARPLTNLTKKDIEFEWTHKCQESFNYLRKDSLMQELILKYPDPNKPYILFTDVSKYALACVLIQTVRHQINDKTTLIEHPITYQSHTKVAYSGEVNYTALTKEAYIIFMSVKKLVYYLEDAEFTLHSDHLPPRTFLEKNTLNSKVNKQAGDISSKYNLNTLKILKIPKQTL